MKNMQKIMIAVIFIMTHATAINASQQTSDEQKVEQESQESMDEKKQAEKLIEKQKDVFLTEAIKHYKAALRDAQVFQQLYVPDLFYIFGTYNHKAWNKHLLRNYAPHAARDCARHFVNSVRDYGTAYDMLREYEQANGLPDPHYLRSPKRIDTEEMLAILEDKEKSNKESERHTA